MQKTKKIFFWTMAVLGVTLQNCQQPKQIGSSVIEELQNTDFVTMKYNNPTAPTDLGVGLWAWPVPMDFDNDGDMDSVVSCPDVPFNGTYFFENKFNGSVKMPVFESSVKIGAGMKNLQVYHGQDGIKVLGRGVEYLNFTDQVFDQPKTLFSAEKIEAGH